MRKAISVLMIMVMLTISGCSNMHANRLEMTSELSVTDENASELGTPANEARTEAPIMTEESVTGKETEKMSDGSWAFYMYVCGSDLESQNINTLSFVTEKMISEEAAELKKATEKRNEERIKEFVHSIEENGLNIPQSLYNRTQVLDYPDYLYEFEYGQTGNGYSGYTGEESSLSDTEDEIQITSAEYDEMFFSTTLGSATGDFMEMMQASPLPENVKFIIMTGGAYNWSNGLVDCNRAQTFLFDSEGFQEIENEPVKNMGNKETLTGFLKYCKENYPAEHTVCLFWDHGAGCFGFAFDELFQDTLSLKEIQSAFSEVYEKNPDDPPLEFVGFDACLMGSLEVANALSGYAGYLLASEETEPSTGWDYQTWISRFTKNTEVEAPELCKIIADSYIETTIKTLKELDEEADITMSVTDLGKAKELYGAYDKLMQKTLADSLESADVLSFVSRAASGATRFSGSSHYIYNTIDLGMFINKIPSIYPEEQKELMTLLDETVVYKSNTEFANEAMGLSVYYPITIKDLSGLTYFLEYVNDICASQSISDLYYYKIAGCLSTERKERLKARGLPEAGTLDSDCLKKICDHEMIVSDDNTLELQLGKEEYELIQDLFLNIAEYDSKTGNVIYLGSDCFVGLNDDCTVVSGFDGKWLSLGGEPLFLEVIDFGEDYIKYSSPILYNGSLLKLNVILDNNTGETHLMGLSIPSDETARLSRKLIELNEGDIITPIYIKGNIDSPNRRQIPGKQITYSKEMDIEELMLDDGNYIEAITFFNIRGDEYSGPVVSFNITDSVFSDVQVCEELMGTDN